MEMKEAFLNQYPACNFFENEIKKYTIGRFGIGYKLYDRNEKFI